MCVCKKIYYLPLGEVYKVYIKLQICNFIFKKKRFNLVELNEF